MDLALQPESAEYTNVFTWVGYYTSLLGSPRKGGHELFAGASALCRESPREQLMGCSERGHSGVLRGEAEAWFHVKTLGGTGVFLEKYIWPW